MFKQDSKPQPNKQKTNIHDSEDEFCRRLAEILIKQAREEEKNSKNINNKNHSFKQKDKN